MKTKIRFLLLAWMLLPLVSGAQGVLWEDFEWGGDMPEGWSEVSTGGSGWIITPAYPGELLPHQGTYHALFLIRSNSGAGDTSWLISPPMNLAGVTQPVLRFWYANVGMCRNGFPFRISYRVNEASPWVTLLSTGEEVYNWTEMEIPLPAEATLDTAFQLRFEALYRSFIDGGLYLDEVYVGERPSDDSTRLPQREDTAIVAAPVTSYPYFTSFDDEEGMAWELQGTDTSRWQVGVIDDETVLFLSNDNGISCNYAGDVRSTAYASRRFLMEEGSYDFAFDWWRPLVAYSASCSGLQVYLVPDSVEDCREGLLLHDGTHARGPNRRYVTGSVAVDSGLYRMVFLWYNDYAGFGLCQGTKVDNLMVVRSGCAAPLLTLESPSATEIVASWQPQGDETMWVVTGNGLTDTTYDTNYTFLYLTPRETYFIGVQAVCGDGQVSLFTQESLQTGCPEVTIPFVENFESADYFATPDCWIVLQSRYASIAPYCIPDLDGNFFLSFSNEQMIATPLIPLQANEIAVSFRIQDYYDEVTQFQVGFVPEGDSASSFIPVATIDPSQEWEYHTVYFDSIGTSVWGHVAFNMPTGSRYYTVHLDDVIVHRGTICRRPLSMGCREGTGTTLDLFWRPDPLAADRYEVAYLPYPGSDPSQGTIITDIYDTTITITGLDDSLEYNFFVRAACDDDSSIWYGPMRLKPFDGIYMKPTGMESRHRCSGTVYDDGGPDKRYSSNCNSTLTLYPDPGHALRIEGTVKLSSDFNDTLFLYDGVDGPLIASYYYRLVNQWYVSEFTVGPFTNYSNRPVVVRFVSDSTGNEAGYALSLACQPNACPQVADLRVAELEPHEAVLQWTPMGQESLWEVRLEGNTYLTSSPTITLANLVTARNYDVAVRPICGEGDTGQAATLRFTTPLCPDATADTLGLGHATSCAAPVDTYFKYSVSQLIYDAAELTDLTAVSGFAFYYLGATPLTAKSNVDIYLSHTTRDSFYSDDDFIPLDSTAVLIFSGALEMTQGWNYLGTASDFRYNGTDNLVLTAIDRSGAYPQPHSMGDWRFLATETASLKRASMHSNTLCPQGTDIVAFARNSATQGYGTASFRGRPNLILVNCGAACLRPSIGAVTDLGYHEATLHWQGDGIAFELQVKPASQPSWNEANTLVLTSFSHRFEGLEMGTTYHFRLRQQCDEETLSFWAEGTFTTLDSVPDIGIPSPTPQPAMELYPNPCASGSCTVVVTSAEESLTLSLVDMHGRTLLRQPMPQGHTQLDLSALPKGVYMVCATGGDTRLMKKLIIQ